MDESPAPFRDWVTRWVSFVRGNPIRYNDPSGHYYCESTAQCTHNIYHTYTSSQLINEVFTDYGVILIGGWTEANKYKAALGITAIGRKLAGDLDKSAENAFSKVYGNVLFEWNPNCPECRSSEQNTQCGSDISSDGCRAGGAVTINAHRIQFVTMSYNIISGRNHVVHELGHAIAWALNNGEPHKRIGVALSSGEPPTRPSLIQSHGFASAGFPWQQSKSNINTPSEIWADQFLGWVFDTWETETNGYFSVSGVMRSEWMATHMAELFQ